MGLNQSLLSLLKLFLIVCAAMLLSACSSIFGAAASKRYIIYSVQQGDTLYKIGTRFNIDHQLLQDLNGISDPRELQIGQVLKIPSSARTSNSKRVDSAKLDRSTPRASLIELGEASKFIGKLVWPLGGSMGRLSSAFGSRWFSFHEGVDLASERGSPVYAAHAGTVVYSGRKLKGYGNLVVVRGAGIMSVYGHNERNLVERGDQVSAGEKIARVGSSGNANGPHLHYEVRIRTVQGYAAVDPLMFYNSQ